MPEGVLSLQYYFTLYFVTNSTYKIERLMNMTENELAAEIKAGTVSGCYFFYGDEDYMKNHRAAEMKKCVTGDYPDFASFNAIDLNFGDGEIDFAALSNALSSPPLMAPSKIVTVSFASLDSFKEKERAALFELLEEYAYDGQVVVVKASSGGFDPGTAKKPSATLAAAMKFMKCVSFDYQSDRLLIRWMERHFGEYGLAVHQSTAQMILNSCGRSMYRLSGEIAKTAAYTAASGRNTVTPEDVGACVTRTDEDDAFRLANCILEGNTASALDALSVKMRKKEEPVFLLSQIVRVFTDLCTASLFISDGREKNDYASAVKMHEYKAGLYYRAAKLKSPEFFVYAAEVCANADRALKSGGAAGDGYGVIEQLICTLAEV